MRRASACMNRAALTKVPTIDEMAKMERHELDEFVSCAVGSPLPWASLLTDFDYDYVGALADVIEIR